jgi:membrane protease YdiL (CAAX protease family)
MGFIAAIFVNKTEKRMRAGWRVLIHFVGWVLMLTGVSLAAAAIPDPALASVAYGALYIIFGFAFTWLVARFIDRRRLAAYGFHLSGGWWADLVFGMVLGVVLMCAIVAVMLNAGWATLEQVSVTDLGVPIAAALAISFLTMIAVGIHEELAFRGYQLRNIAEGFSWLGPRKAMVIAMVISSAIFGTLHLANELGGGAHTTELALTNLILAGLMLALPYLLTGELAISIGIHITWNFFQGPIFGLPVSGGDADTHLVTVTDTGPAFWTGGDYGAEGGMLATIAIVAGMVVSIIWIALRKRRVALETDVATYTPR